MSESELHPAPDRLEALVEGGLAEADRAPLEQHLLSCTRCQVDLDDWRTLFTTLSALPRHAPAAGFADRVLARIRIRRPWAARAAAALGRLAPRTTTGWALVTACLALPVAAATALVLWVLAWPGLTAQTLLVFVRDRAAGLMLSFAGDAATTAMESTLAVELAAMIEKVLAAAPMELGAAAAVFATMTAASVWVLYRNLFRPSTREVHHASFLF